MYKMKIAIIAAIMAHSGWLGILAVPVFLLVLCNLIDYATGLMAAPYRTESVNSYKGIRGIVKKVCMWLLIVVGVIVDAMLNYAVEYIGWGIALPFIVATVVAVWLLVNEIISILENILDIGVTIPPAIGQEHKENGGREDRCAGKGGRGWKRKHCMKGRTSLITMGTWTSSASGMPGAGV